jgi:hypothetical protein
VDYPIVYTDPPENMVLANDPDSVLRFRIASEGFELFILKYFTRRNPIEIKLNRLNLRKEGDNYFSNSPTAEIAGSIIHKLNLSEELVDISPKTIYFKFELLSRKRIKVVNNITLQFKKQFQLADSIIISPDSVNIVGPDHVIKGMNWVITAPVTFENIHESKTVLVDLVSPAPDKSISIDPEKVEITIPVEKYTEGMIEVPVTQMLDKNLRIKTFPEKVKITYTVALKDFKRVSAEMFVAAILYKPGLESDRLPVNLVRKPNFIDVVNIEPEMVEFLVLKK